MACADVVTAKAKAATAINLIISFSHVLASTTNHALLTQVIVARAVVADYQGFT